MGNYFMAPSVNYLTKTLSGGIDDSVTTITLNNTTNLLAPGYIVVDRTNSSGVATPDNREVIYYTGISGSDLTGCVRAADNSTARTHADGALVETTPTVGMWNSLTTIVSTALDSNSYLKAIASPVSIARGEISFVKASSALISIATISGHLNASGASIVGGFPSSDPLTIRNASFTSTASIAALQTPTPTESMYRNALINGSMDIWQRATTFTTPNDDTFGPDRWNFLVDGNGAWTFTRDTDVPTGDFTYSLKCTNVTLNKQCGIVQILENVDSEKLQGKKASLSFYAKTTGTEIGNLRATVLSWDSTANSVTSDVVGTWAGAGTDPTWATNWTAEVAGSNKALTASWQRFTIENISLDTSDINNIAVVIWVDDTTISANDDFWVTGVQLNEGEVATKWQPRHYITELMLSQRYCWALTEASNGVIGNGRNESTTRALIWLPHPVEMFREPTLTATAGDWQVLHTTSATDCSAVQLFSGAGTLKGTLFGFDVAAGLTAGQACQVRADAGGTRVLILDAEL